ncbi:hypothetical protein GCM10020295_36990 [Streptomyces cinereospinus]
MVMNWEGMPRSANKTLRACLASVTLFFLLLVSEVAGVTQSRDQVTFCGALEPGQAVEDEAPVLVAVANEFGQMHRDQLESWRNLKRNFVVQFGQGREGIVAGELPEYSLLPFGRFVQDDGAQCSDVGVFPGQERFLSAGT